MYTVVLNVKPRFSHITDLIVLCIYILKNAFLNVMQFFLRPEKLALLSANVKK